MWRARGRNVGFEAVAPFQKLAYGIDLGYDHHRLGIALPFKRLADDLTVGNRYGTDDMGGLIGTRVQR